MRNFTYTFETQKRSFISALSICMTLSLITNCKKRKLFTISYTLALEKYFVKLYNRSTLGKFDLFCVI